MKKFLLTSCAILSVIGVQAGTTFNKADVTYDATLKNGPIVIEQKSDTVKELYAEDVRTTAKVLFSMDIHDISTNEYIYTATATKIANVASANIYSFKEYTAGNKSAYTGTLANPENYYVVGSSEYSEYFEDIDAAMLTANNIKKYDDMAAETGVTGYYYWVFDANQEVWVATYTTDVNNSNLNTSGYYQKYVNSNTNKVFYYLIRTIGVARRFANTIHRIDSCAVTNIAQTIAMNSYIQTISLGKDITSIAAGAFLMDSKLNNFSIQDGGNFIYENGILYDAAKDNIIAASKDVTSQTIPSSVKEIYTFAFFNTVSQITIYSMNSTLTKNEGSQGSNVTFVTPDTNLTVSEQNANGGYTITGNVTQSNFNSTISGIAGATYYDFRSAVIMEDLTINNQKNAIYYFNTDVNVSGNNVVNKNVCENFVLKDDYRNTKFFCPYTFNANNVSYNRQMTENWVTLSLPFSLDANALNDKLYLGEFGAYNDESALFTFIYANALAANTPYIVKTKATGDTFNVNATDVKVYATEERVIKPNNSTKAAFHANFTPRQIVCNSTTNYFGIKNTVVQGETFSSMVKIDGATVNAFRAFLSAPASETNFQAARIRLVDAMDNVIEEIELPYTTGIETVKDDKIEEAIYDLNGQSLKEVKRGLNIVNGKIIINK